MTGAVRESRFPSYLALFASLGTLLCCALPSLLVLLGFGASVASFLSAAPWLVIPSRHKGWVFGVTALLIATNFYYVYRLVPGLLSARAACPPEDHEACAAASRVSRVVLWLSAAIFCIGFFVAFLLGPMLARVAP